MGLFARDASCDACGTTLPKKELHRFDPTWRRERKTDDARRRLCRGCLASAVGASLREFPFRALVIAPAPEGGGYSFAALDIPLRFFVWTEELRERVRELLPDPAARCARCTRPARVNWCGLDIFVDSPYELDLRPRGEFSETPLCGSCAGSEVERCLRESTTVFQEVLPPADGDGVLTPAEY